MNWTGGCLSRHSRNASVKDKQKQHFAKVRNNLLNGKANLSFLEKSTVLEFPTFAGRTSQVPGATAIDVDRDLSSPGKYSSSIIKKTSLQQTVRSIPARTWHDNGGNRSGNDSLPTKFLVHQQRALFANAGVDEAPYSAKTDIVQTRDSPKRVMGGTHMLELDADILEATRRNLLSQRDWTGLQIQRPLEIKFTSAAAERMLGKRRRLSHNHCATYGGGKRLSSPLAPPSRQHSTVSKSSKFKNCQRYLEKPQDAREEIRVVIGGKEIRMGGTSTTLTSKKLHLATKSLAPLPDIMLLDADQRIKGTFSDDHEDDRSDATHITLPNFPRNPTPRPNANEFAFNSNLSRRHFPSEHMAFGNVDESCAPKYFIGSLESEAENEVLVQPLRWQNNPEADYNKGRSTAPTDRFDAELRTLESPELRLQKSALLSPADLHHPLPLSSKTSSLIRSSSVAANSTAAQIGVNTPVVPESQKLDDEVWKTWIALSDEDVLYKNNDHESSSIDKRLQRDDKSVSISPGISAVGQKAVEIYEAKNVVLKSNSLTVDHKSKQSNLRGTRRGDPDEAWKKFVFTNDDEEDENIDKDQSYETKSVFHERTCQTPASSMIGNLSVASVSISEPGFGPSSNIVEVNSSPFPGEPFDEGSLGGTDQESRYIEISSSPALGGRSPNLVAAQSPSKLRDEKAGAERACSHRKTLWR